VGRPPPPPSPYPLPLFPPPPLYVYILGGFLQVKPRLYLNDAVRSEVKFDDLGREGVRGPLGLAAPLSGPAGPASRARACPGVCVCVCARTRSRECVWGGGEGGRVHVCACVCVHERARLEWSRYAFCARIPT
jgi:hypothetical protein